ncbi:HesB/YadR/YfhF family protein [Litchfieldia salsa]|uniref:Uncharacterized protein YneR n=1 Tax=Litchfieldia salsa TaxID=930152 RepID=A0A1H0STL8_9BACI|nr:HesB/YadR/YfhF family protein [Litchfieldia salsa]SDP44606.1 Uncharacterized protein YneR [Litchfieldia salsa]
MEIQIDTKAADWYKRELNLGNGDSVRFFVRYGGSSSIQPGFSLGVSKDTPEDTGSQTNESGIMFFIQEDDLWYFKDHDLIINYDEKAEEPVFNYQ